MQEGENLQIEENIGKIAQAIEKFRSHITELMELLQPFTPLEVISQREYDVTGNKESIAQSIQEITKLYDRSAQFWMNLQENEKLQELDKKEEGMNIAV
jgi:plasmid maintenance system antidote protein VapI